MAIAVVRISGPGIAAALELLAPGEALQDRVATLRTLRDPETLEALDRAIVLRFYAPRSYTGEEMAELHLTGGHAVLAGVISALGRIAGLRPAEAGEFAWRAFENGKIDLSEIEGLADLVSAETAAQRRQALRIAGGALSREVETIRALLVRAMSTLEAQIDFSDVEDAGALLLTDASELVREGSDRIRAVLASSQAGRRLREGLNVIIAGPPNVGKSTLMNLISKREVSIVSPTPGTTRDIIEVALDIKGYPVTLVDCAGIRDTGDPIEREGVERARRRMKSADLTIWLLDRGTAPIEIPETEGASIIIESKSDQTAKAKGDWAKRRPALRISAKTGDGIPELLEEIGRFAAKQFEGSGEALITTERHRIAFLDAERSLARVLGSGLEAVELVAEELRWAARAMERITGRIDVEEVLSQIFSRLCIGK